ncbi:hypothetical protein VNO80_24633 [Phaseolus coccineus]|uniref:Uncharacterized protein n=1 Tax=Phaseolus coccineus TaxID=3886 RepID=A0AAN9LTW1_PHACN
MAPHPWAATHSEAPHEATTLALPRAALHRSTTLSRAEPLPSRTWSFSPLSWSRAARDKKKSVMTRTMSCDFDLRQSARVFH